MRQLPLITVRDGALREESQTQNLGLPLSQDSLHLLYLKPHSMPVDRCSVPYWIDVHIDWRSGQWVSGGGQGFLGKSPLIWRPEALNFVGVNDPKWKIPK